MGRLQTALAVGALVVGGAAAGWVRAAAEAVERGDTAPPGWTRVQRPAPYMNPATLGRLGVDPGAWMLGRFAALEAPSSVERLSLTAALGEDGSLVVLPKGGGAARPVGPGVVFEAGQPPRGVRLQSEGPQEDLLCEGNPSALGSHVEATLFLDGPMLVAETPEGTLRCGAGGGTGPPVLQAGLRRVHLHSLEADGAPVPSSASPSAGHVLLGAVSALLFALLLATALALLAAGGGSRRARAASHLHWLGLQAVPLLLCLPLAGWDTGALREVFRMPSLSLHQVPFWVGVAPTLVLWTLYGSYVLARGNGRPTWAAGALLAAAAGTGVGGGAGLGLAVGLVCVAPLSARLLRRDDAVSSAGTLAAVALCTAAAALVGATASSAVSRLYLGLAGACAGGLVWALSRALHLRAYNTLSLVLALLAAGSLETATRFTAVGPFWRGTEGVQAAGSAASLVQEFEALEARQPTDWPEAGFPVHVPPKTARLRVVALGGSSTAGAYQNHRLDEFYPARMAELLGPEVDVVNQGVGGWNTLHLARFADTHLDRLQADVVTVYTGVNEMVEVPVTYRELHAAWTSGALRAGPALLDDVRLFHGFRLAVRALRGSTVAVPPPHTRDHLDTLAKAAARSSTRVLLLSEAVQPRPEALTPWWQAMQSVAEAHDHVSFFHSAPVLQPLGGSAFLDTNHLSDAGHRALAVQVVGELRRLGWVDQTTTATVGTEEPPSHAQP